MIKKGFDVTRTFEHCCYLRTELHFSTVNVVGLWFMMFNTTFSNISVISWLSVVMVEETGENHHPVASH